MDIRSALTELCNAFNAHDLDRIMVLFADDCVLEMPRGSMPWGARFEGKRNVREGLRKEVHGCDFYTFRDGKVIRKDSYWKIVE